MQFLGLLGPKVTIGLLLRTISLKFTILTLVPLVRPSTSALRTIPAVLMVYQFAALRIPLLYLHPLGQLYIKGLEVLEYSGIV